MTTISISGTPATGKTEVGKLLAKKLGFGFIQLNELAKKKNLYCGFDRKRKCRIVDIGKVEKEVEKVGGNLVIESHYSQNIKSDLIVVLRCETKELRKRMERKKWTKEKIEENIEAEIMEVCLSEAVSSGERVVVADTTSRRAESVAEEIAKQLKSLKAL